MCPNLNVRSWITVPNTTVCISPPLADFPWSIFDISTVGIVGIVGTVSVPNRSALETSRPELFKDVSFGINTIGTIGTIVEQSSLENRPRGV